MNLITWNLNGLEDKHLDERTEAAMFQILLGAPLEKAMQAGFKPSTPDIVVLQEVVERSYHAHIKPHLQAAGFEVFPKEPSERSYFEVIATRLPVVDFSYEAFEYSDQGRGLSTLKLDNLSVLTAHMESMKPGATMRIEQAKYILDLINKLGMPCIFAGDTNLRKAEWEDLPTENISDAWEASGSPKQHKYTWQKEKYKARYDRIWTYQVSVKKFETFGNNKVIGINETSSDHRGLKISF